MSVEASAPVPLRVVPPPTITGGPGPTAQPGTTSRAALLEPLSMREKALVCAVAEALTALRKRAEAVAPENDGGFVNPYFFDPAEKYGILNLLVAFKDATGCRWVDANWG
jgi:hypothetical protein